MRLKRIDVQIEPGLRRIDQRTDDRRRRNLPQPHADECSDADVDPRGEGLDPEADRNGPEDDPQDKEGADEHDEDESRRRRHGEFSLE